MAKLKAPLFSLGASQQLGKALVYFGWKGLDVVREYVIPANPNTAPQQTQRGYVTDAVAAVHDAQAAAVGPLNAGDVTAYAALAGTIGRVMTWFNAAVRQFVNQRVAALFGCIFHQGSTEENVDELVFNIRFTEDADSVNAVTAGNFHYGTSPTALITTVAAVIVGQTASATVGGLVTGTKYYWQFRPTLHANFVGTRSGIYHGTPT